MDKPSAPSAWLWAFREDSSAPRPVSRVAAGPCTRRCTRRQGRRRRSPSPEKTLGWKQSRRRKDWTFPREDVEYLWSSKLILCDHKWSFCLIILPRLYSYLFFRDFVFLQFRDFGLMLQCEYWWDHRQWVLVRARSQGVTARNVLCLGASGTHII